MKVVQLGVIGAMQRAHPALTQMWLRWTGIPELEQARFETATPEVGRPPGTCIHLLGTDTVHTGWKALCDTLAVEEDAPERRTMPIVLSPRAASHMAFWLAMRHRELTLYEGPLEWWWRLLVLRMRGLRPASRVLIEALFGDAPELDHAVVRFDNPALKQEGRQTSTIVNGVYHQPTHMTLALRAKRADSRAQGLAFPLSERRVSDRLIPTLLDAAIVYTA